MASPDLVWELVKKHNKFVLRRDGLTFSKDPFSITNKHSFKESGLANKKAVGLNFAEDEPNFEADFVTKTTKAAQPAKSEAVTKFDGKKGYRKVSRSVAKNTRGMRKDLRKAALRRWAKIYKASMNKDAKGKKK